MSAVTEAAVFDALRTVQEPELGGDLVTRNMIKDLVLTGSDVAFTIELTTPACPLKDQIESEVRQALTPVGVEGAWVSVVGEGGVGVVVGGGGDDDEHASVDTLRSFWPERLPAASYASTAIV